MTTFAELVAVGFVIGTFVGVSGVGGGSIMTPILMLLLGVNPLVAVGTDLLYSVPTKILGAFVHARQRTIDWRIVRALLYGGLPGAMLGLVLMYAARHFVDAQILSLAVKRCVGVALFVSAGSLAFGALSYRGGRAAERPVQDIGRPRAAVLAMCGGLVGFLVALTSVGSGSITMPLLLAIVPFVGLRRLVGCDIAFAAFLIPLAAFGHAALGDVNYPVALCLLVGSLPGVLVGSRLCGRLPQMWLRPAVAVVLVAAGSRLI
jgi:uncharacterized membrane protein YfcA